jgi:hypothetical protein
VEAVHIDCPWERAYIMFDSIGGMRGDVLKYYIDEELCIYESAEKAEEEIGNLSTGFGKKIGHI